MEHTSMGAQLIYEKRFAATTSDQTENKQRHQCAKKEARASVSGSGWGFHAHAAGGVSEEICNTINNNNHFSSAS